MIAKSILIISAFSTAALVSGCGGVVGSGTGGAPQVAITSPQFVYTLPEDVQMPPALAGDVTGRGVWFLSGSDKGTAFYHVGSVPSDNHVYPLDSVLSFGADGGIAAARDGTVWAGVGMTLFHLIPSTGKVVTYGVPTPADSAAAESYRPQSVKGAHDIRSVAVSSTGQVALAISAAAAVTVFDAGTFSSRSLPSGTEPVDVAYLVDGTLGVNLVDFATHRTDEVETFSAAGVSTLRAQLPAPRLVANGDTLVTITDHVTSIDAQARVRASLPLVASRNQGQPISVYPMAALPSGNVVVPSKDGVVLANVSTGQSVDLQFPPVACWGPGVALPPGVTLPPTPSNCPEHPVLVAADAVQNVWMILPDDQHQIALLAGIGF